MQTPTQTQRFISQEILTLANELVSKFWDMYSYDVYEVADNLMDYPEDTEKGELKEVFQWYLITEYAYDKLNAIDEPVYYSEELNMWFWGRTCFGQLIETDGTIQQALGEEF